MFATRLDMRGQMTFEFLGTIVIAMLIYAIFYMFILTQFAGMLPWDNQNHDARFHANRVAEQIGIAYASGDGYRSSFELPEMIRGRDYIVAHGPGVIEVDIADVGEVDSYGIGHFVADEVEIRGIGNGTNSIINTNGTVVIWQ